MSFINTPFINPAYPNPYSSMHFQQQSSDTYQQIGLSSSTRTPNDQQITKPPSKAIPIIDPVTNKPITMKENSNKDKTSEQLQKSNLKKIEKKNQSG